MTTLTTASAKERNVYFVRLAMYCLIGLSFAFAVSNWWFERYEVSLYNGIFGLLFTLLYWVGKSRHDWMVIGAALVCQSFFFGHAYWMIPGKQMEDALGAMMATLPIFMVGFRLWYFVITNTLLFHLAFFNADYGEVFYAKYVFYIVLFFIIRALVTRNQRYERELIVQHDKIVRDADRLRELDELRTRFFANVSHELRTPLTLVLSPLDTILRSNELSNRNFTYLRLVKKNAGKLLRRVNELLELSRLDEDRLQPRPEPTNCYQFTKQMVALYEGEAGIKGIRLDYESKLSPARLLLLDQAKFEMIVTNLLSNALKFTPRGGSISVVLERAEAELLVSVSDTGDGIPAEERSAIFERFYQAAASSRSGGSGIGLSLSREMAERMGGSLKVQSQVGEGSTFYLRLPFRETYAPVVSEPAEELAALPIAVDSAAPRLELPRILVVEDNYDLQHYLQLLLADDYQVSIVDNGRAAWEFMQEANGKNELPALIISDIMMPEMDGMELLGLLKEAEDFLAIPVIMLTAQQATQVKIEALRIGVDDYLVKPFVAEELSARVRNLLLNTERKREARKETAGDDRKTPSGSVSKADLKWLETVEAHILERISDGDFRLADLAGELFVAPRTLHRKIKSITGFTPKQYERKIKLHEARRILQAGEVQTVRELSDRLGFEDQHYFSKIYPKDFGVTPRTAINE